MTAGDSPISVVARYLLPVPRFQVGVVNESEQLVVGCGETAARHCTNPTRCAYATIAPTVDTPSFSLMLARWLLMVLDATFSSAATSATPRPRAMDRNTWCSRGVSVSWRSMAASLA